MDSPHLWEYYLVKVKYTFIIITNIFSSKLLLNDFYLTEISIWTVHFACFFFLIHLVKCVFVLKFSSFYYVCYFSSTTVKKVCLLDINNFQENSSKTFIFQAFLHHSCHGKSLSFLICLFIVLSYLAVCLRKPLMDSKISSNHPWHGKFLLP